MESETVMDDLRAKAREIGRMTGVSAAEILFDGNTDDAVYVKVLKGIEDGDPEVMDAYSPPDMSHEYQDDGIDEGVLWEELGLSKEDAYDGHEWTALGAELIEAWEDGCKSGFWDEVERICREHVASVIERKVLEHLETASAALHEAQRNAILHKWNALDDCITTIRRQAGDIEELVEEL